MQQLDLFSFRPDNQQELLLLPPRRSLFTKTEAMCLGACLSLFLIYLVPQNTPEAPVVLGIAIKVEANEPVPVPRPAPSPILIKTTPSQQPVRAQNLSVPVLMYHHVGPPPTQNALDRSLTVSTAEFEEQIVFFKNKGFQSVTLAQVYDALSEGKPLPSKPIVFTFDDGYKDVFVNAVPILKKHGFVGTFAVAPSLLEGNEYATWGDVYAAFKDGMEIVSHSLNHVDFTNSSYSDEFLLTELEGSKLFLESRISSPVNFFVYPYGRYNARAIELVKKAGYKMAFTTELGIEMNLNIAYHLPRVRVHGQGGLAKLKQALGL